MPLPDKISINDPIIKVNNTVKNDIIDDIIEVTVDNAYYLPGMFTILLTDQEIKHSSVFKTGAEVSIEMREMEAGSWDKTIVMIKGQITTAEYIFTQMGLTHLVVRGYDKAYKLTQGKATRTFVKQKASDMIMKAIQDKGLTAQVDASSVQYEHFWQYNQTNWDFILAHARRLGYVVYVQDGTELCVKKPASRGDITLKFLESLRSFEPKLSVLGQYTNVTVSGWDPKQKKAISGKASSSTSAPFHSTGSGNGSSTAKKAVGAIDELIVDHPLFNAKEASDLASGAINFAESQFIRAEGMCDGNAKLMPGCLVDIKNVGQEFSGKYIATQVRHEWARGGFVTYFTVSGATPEALPYILNFPDVDRDNLINGVVPALVTNNDYENAQESNKIPSVKVKYPWLDDQLESGWIRITFAGGGKDRGIFFLPEVDDEVLVAFEHGDINAPYIIAGLYNGKDTPPLSGMVKGGVVNTRTIKTRSGHIIEFSDESGKENVTIQTKSGHIILLDDASGKENILIKDKSGKNSIQIDSTKNSMTFNAMGDMTFDAKGKISIKSTGPMNVESTGKATIKGTGGASLEGMTVDITANTKASVKGNAGVEVSSPAITEIKGSLVKIN